MKINNTNSRWRTISLFTILFSLFSIVGCQKDNYFGSENIDGKVQFSSEIIESRASGTMWDAADKIGITMYATSTSTVSGSVENICYQTATTLGNFVPIDPAKIIYYPPDGSRVDFVAYYPYTSDVSITKCYSLDVKKQVNSDESSNLPAIDFMLSNNLVDKGKSTSAQVLEFEHKLSNIIINAKAGGTLTNANLKNMIVKVKGTKLKATYDMSPNTATPIDFGSAVAQDVTLLYSATTTPTYHAEGILIPQTWSKGDVVLEFTLEGLPNKFEVAVSDIKFESGKKYTYNVTITPQAVIIGESTITDWVSGNGATGEDLEANQKIPYIEINGLKWATGNLVADGENGCKIGAPEDGGLYFQFGSLVGWAGGATGDGTGRSEDMRFPAIAVKIKPATCSYTYNGTDDSWMDISKIWQGLDGTVPQKEGDTDFSEVKGVGDPCSYYLKGTWRLPTKTEWITLMGNYAGGEWNAAIDWYPAGKFGNGEINSYATHTVSGLKIPASGYRFYNSGTLTASGEYGCCWSSSVYNIDSGDTLLFNSLEIYPEYIIERSFGLPVRCVKE